jgi:hypothetical protein
VVVPHSRSSSSPLVIACPQARIQAPRAAVMPHPTKVPGRCLPPRDGRSKPAGRARLAGHTWLPCLHSPFGSKLGRRFVNSSYDHRSPVAPVAGRTSSGRSRRWRHAPKRQRRLELPAGLSSAWSLRATRRPASCR